MKIAILGGGFTGLTTSYYLAKKGHDITLFEKEKILGGLSSGFKAGDWDWPLERTYHHLLASDFEIMKFAEEVGFDGIFYKSPETASLYDINGNFSIFPLATPVDLLRFPLLGFPDKIRAGMVIAFLKLSPFLSIYEKQTAQEFLQKTMGSRAWDVLWQELFRKKFGKYAGNILTSFFWARIKKRSKNLGYIERGFQTFIDYLEKINKEMGVVIKKDFQIDGVGKSNKGFIIQNNNFDTVISTLPTPVLTKIADKVFPANYLAQLNRIKYLYAVNFILETENPILEKTYWLNICVKDLPMTILAQHTNLIDKKHYDNKHLLYIGNYVDEDDKLLQMNKEETLKYFLPHLYNINSKFIIHNSKFYLFKSPFAQPIFDKNFLVNKPDFTSPVKNFYIANLDMTYPFDRGTNYAVELGRKVSEMI